MVVSRNSLYILIIISTLLTACSFTETEQSSGHVYDRSSLDKEEVPTGEEDDEVIRLYEQNITYLVDGLEHSETGFLNTSTNQLFSIYLFKDFQLEVAAPGQDVLLHKEKEDVYMSIELIPEDINFFELEYDTYKQLNVISNSIHREVWNQPDLLLKGAVMLHAENEYESVQVILIKDRAHFPNMKLTIHAPKDDEVVEKFLSMAKTIVKTSMNR
ncbi:hypothetical protein IM538_20960 [Cytobacillus suaedae]|nr:hypothetical protein IM538_20960 [Cytobacillus suaedae]